MNNIINESELQDDIAKGLMYYGRMTEKRAKELAWLNVTFVAEEMYEAQDAVVRDIAEKELQRKKGLL